MEVSCVCLCMLKGRLTQFKRKQNLCEEGTSVLLLQGKSRSISIHQHALSLFLAPWCPPSSSLANSLLTPPPPHPTLSDFFQHKIGVIAGESRKPEQSYHQVILMFSQVKSINN